MAPAVFVHKKSGDIQLCIDYRELNKRTVKIAYLQSCPDEVHDQILDVLYFLQNTCRMAGYWQLSVIQQSTQRQHSHSSRLGNLPVSQHAFCCWGPIIWWTSSVMSYPLSLSTVMTSASIQPLSHSMKNTYALCFTTHVKKRCIGLSHFAYLECISAQGTEPDPQIFAVQDVLTPETLVTCAASTDWHCITTVTSLGLLR